MTLPSMTEALAHLLTLTSNRQPLGQDRAVTEWVKDGLAAETTMYENKNERLNIDFRVERLAFPHLQTMDPRVVRIAPAKNNERHRHAHESLFVILSGEGEVLVGENWTPVKAGDIAFVPRWIFHQTRNTHASAELVVLAITDFGFTSAVLGDYDKRTRLSQAGDDVTPGP